MVTEANSEEIQTFSQWSSQRFEVYQQVEQQAQSSITQILQLARDLTTRMEEEAGQLLARYQQERSTLQTEVEDLRYELHTLQQEKARTIQEQEQVQQQLEQTRTQIETERKEALAERQQILQNAYAERDRILAEAYQFVQKLVGEEGRTIPQQEPSARPFSALPAQQSPVYHPPVGEAEEEPTNAYQSEYTDGEPQDGDDSIQQQSEDGYSLIIEGVESFILASELIDRFEENPYTEGVTLTQYEQRTLQLAVQHIEDASLEEIVRSEFHDTLEMVDRVGNTLKLRYKTETPDSSSL
jgi:hypothetical protein